MGNQDQRFYAKVYTIIHVIFSWNLVDMEALVVSTFASYAYLWIQ